jgi:hypothetical protein
MTVVVNDLDVVAPEQSPAPAAAHPAPATPSTVRTERMVEQASRLRAERSHRLKAY